MEPRAHHVLIGLSTLLGAGALLFFSLWLSRSSIEGEGRYYDILFHEAVSGLSVGSSVRYSGIRVGDVERLWLDQDDPRKVWARVRLSGNVPVKTDTRAQLTLLNITGASGIELSQGLPESPLLRANGDEIPVIEAEPSSLARLRSGSDDLVENISTLLERVNRLLSEENADHVSRTLTNIDTVTTLIVEQQDELREGLRMLAASGVQLNRILVRLEERLANEGEELLTEASAALGSVRQVSEALEALLQDNRAALDSGFQGIGDLGPTVQELRSMISRLNALTRQLESGPAAFLLGNDNIKEFAP